ncbi:hypothetical protein JW898_00785 [Candidatus Woesearchaeota archaeon]|nr:hypothetical protein [Candidatus Woesearchaeota archaeon]
MLVEKDRTKEEIIELKAALRMNEFRIRALVNLLAKEGVLSKEEFEEELRSVCEKSG